MKILFAVLSGCGCIALASPPTVAAELSPAEVYALAAPAIGTLELRSADGSQSDLRSALLVVPDRFVSVCDGLAEAGSLQISLPSGRFAARLEAQDAERNLCILSTPVASHALPALALRQTAAQPGLRVFAVANALGYGVGISDGLVSGLRAFPSGDYIQFSAPISPGAQGGALLDSEGKLLGIVDYRQRSGQTVNFAAPAAWIAEIETRAATQGDANRFDAEASKLVSERRWAELDKLARRWASQAPASPQAWRYAALAAGEVGDVAQEERAWRRLQGLDRGSNQGGIGLGAALLKEGRFDDALAEVEKLLARDRQDASIWFLYGRILQAARRAGDAEAAYRQATQLDPWLIRAYVNLAELAQQRGDHATAAAIWSRLSGLDPANTDFRYQLIGLYLQANKPERAFISLAGLPASEVDTATANYLQGLTLRQLGRPVDGVAALRRSIAKAPPGEAQAWIALAIALAELDRHPEAIEASRQALKVAPESDAAKFWLAVELKDGGRANEALAIARELTAAHPADPAAWRQQGFALAVLDQRKAAITALEKSLELDPKQAKVWAALAEVCHADGQQSAARRAYEQLRAVDPEYARDTYRTLIVTYEEGAQ